MAKDILSLGDNPDGPAGRAPLDPLSDRGPVGGILLEVEGTDGSDLGEGEAMTLAHREVKILICGRTPEEALDEQMAIG